MKKDKVLLFPDFTFQNAIETKYVYNSVHSTQLGLYMIYNPSSILLISPTELS